MKLLVGYKSSQDEIAFYIIESDKSITWWKTSIYDAGVHYFKNNSIFKGYKLQTLKCNEVLQLDWTSALILDGEWFRCIDKHCYKLPYKIRDNKLP